MKRTFFPNPQRSFVAVVVILALAAMIPGTRLGTPSEASGDDNTVVFLPFLLKAPVPIQNILMDSFGGNNPALMVQNGFAYVGEGSRLVIVDVHNLAQPVRVASLTLPGTINHIQISGNYVYLAVSHGGLVIIDISQPNNPQQAGQMVSNGQARHVSILGNVAYLSTSAALQIVDISVPGHPLLLGEYAVDAQHTQVGGDFLAYVDTGNGFQIVDVHDPYKPGLVGSYSLGLGHLRQVKDNIAYVTISDCFMNWCDSELQTVNVSSPSSPVLMDRYQVSGNSLAISGFQISGGLAYVGIHQWLDIVDISDPAHMTRLGRYQSSISASPFLVTGNFAYLGGGLALEVVDVSDPSLPTLVKTFNSADTVTSDIPILVGNDLYYRTTDDRVTNTGSYLYTGFHIIDVSTPLDPTLAGKYITEKGYAAYEVQVVNGYAYVVGDNNPAEFADTDLSLRVVDVHNIHNPTLLTDYVPASGGGIWSPWYPNVTPVQVIGDTAYIITGYGMLEITDMSNPASPAVLGSTGSGLTGVRVVGEHAYLTFDIQPQTGFEIADISNPHTIPVLGTYTATQTSGVPINGLKVLNGLAYLGVGEDLQIVDVGDATNPTLVGTYTSGAAANITGVEATGDRAYIAFEGGRLEIVDTSHPASPTLISTYMAASTITGIQSLGNTLYVVLKENEIQAIDVTNPAQPSPVYRYPTDAYSMQVMPGGIGYIAAGNSGVQIVSP